MAISIHAPPRGATDGGNRHKAGHDYFNSRPSARGDEHRRGAEERRRHISIHAPPRGATPAGRWTQCPPAYFNSRPSARGDQYLCCHILSPSDFNSRPSARGDHKDGRTTGRLGISIHAPPRGATRWDINWCLSLTDFNSRPSARGDRKRYAISANLLFNPYKSAWLNNRATQFVEIILVIFHRIIV